MAQGIPVMFDVQDVSLLIYITLLSLQWFAKNLWGSSQRHPVSASLMPHPQGRLAVVFQDLLDRN